MTEVFRLASANHIDLNRRFQYVHFLKRPLIPGSAGKSKSVRADGGQRQLLRGLYGGRHKVSDHWKTSGS